MNDAELDTLLSRPLRDISDNGFGRAVLSRVLALRLRETRLVYATYAVCAIICLMALGATPLGDAIIRASDLASGTFACAALVFSAASAMWIRRVLHY